jgi:hypothetical protein
MEKEYERGIKSEEDLDWAFIEAKKLFLKHFSHVTS